jgi:hypothetical protein
MISIKASFGRYQVSISVGVVRINGIAFDWIVNGCAFNDPPAGSSEVAKASARSKFRSEETKIKHKCDALCGPRGVVPFGSTPRGE